MSEVISDPRAARRDAFVLRLDESMLADAIYRAVIANVPAYARGAVADRGEVREHCRRHGVATYETFRDGAPPDHERLAFVRETACRRAQENVPLAILLHAYRAGYGAVWNTVRDRVQTLGTDMETMLRVAELMMEYFNAISTEATQAYLAERARIAADARLTRQSLVEALLSGEITHSDEIAPQLSAFGLHRGRGCRILLVAHVGCDAAAVAVPGSDALDAIASALQSQDHPLLAGLFHGRVAVVLPTSPDVPPDIAPALASLSPPTGGWIAAGLSLAHARLLEAPQAYAEARLALRIARPHAPFVVLENARLFDAMLAEAGHAMQAILPPWTRPLLDEDPSSALLPTLHAYLDSDLNIVRAAALLHVHPNTVRYRLHRIEAITAASTKSFHDLVEILAVVRLAAGEPQAS